MASSTVRGEPFGVDGGQRLARRGHGHQQGLVARRCRRGRDQHVRRPRPGVAGGQGQVGLVLDLLQPGQQQRGARVPVPEEPPDLGQQLGVGGVAAVHRHLDRLVVERGGELGDAPHLRMDGATSDSSTPSSAAASTTALGAGNPVGDSTTRRTAAATPHPTARLASTARGKPEPCSTAAIAARTTRVRTARRNGRLRLGATMLTTAMATAIRASGKLALTPATTESAGRPASSPSSRTSSAAGQPGRRRRPGRCRGPGGSAGPAAPARPRRGSPRWSRGTTAPRPASRSRPAPDAARRPRRLPRSSRPA